MDNEVNLLGLKVTAATIAADMTNDPSDNPVVIAKELYEWFIEDVEVVEDVPASVSPLRPVN